MNLFQGIKIFFRNLFSKKHPSIFVILSNGWGVRLNSDFVTLNIPNQSDADKAFRSNLFGVRSFAGFLIDAMSGLRLKDLKVGDKVQIVNSDSDRISKEFSVVAVYHKPSNFTARDIIEFSKHTFGKAKNISGEGEKPAQTLILISLITMADMYNTDRATELGIYNYFYSRYPDKASFNTALSCIKNSNLVDIDSQGNLVITDDLLFLAMNAVNKLTPDNLVFPATN